MHISLNDPSPPPRRINNPFIVISVALGIIATILGGLALGHVGLCRHIPVTWSAVLLSIGVTSFAMAYLSHKKWKQIALVIGMIGVRLMRGECSPSKESNTQISESFIIDEHHRPHHSSSTISDCDEETQKLLAIAYKKTIPLDLHPAIEVGVNSGLEEGTPDVFVLCNGYRDYTGRLSYIPIHDRIAMEGEPNVQNVKIKISHQPLTNQLKKEEGHYRFKHRDPDCPDFYTTDSRLIPSSMLFSAT